MKKSLVYFQSGGPTPAINTSLYGVIKEAKKHSEIENIFGSLHGIEGLLNDRLIDLRQEDNAQIELLVQTPGPILGTTRYKMSSDFSHPDYAKILTTLKKHNIGYLFVNGGNDSMDTCHKLSLYLSQVNYDCKVIGIPKTIDNDLAHTDHCVGFPSAAKFVAQSLQDIAIDNNGYQKSKVVIVEVMGRHAGWLTSAAALLDGEIKVDKIYLPEEKFHLDQFLEDVRTTYEQKKKGLFVLSEGVSQELLESTAKRDSFGHLQLGGIASILAEEVKNTFGYSVRPIEFSLLQRASSAYITPTDRKEAIKISTLAVRKAIQGLTDAMIVVTRKSNQPYKVNYKVVKLKHVANVEKKLSPELLADIHGERVLIKEYLRPLIAGTNKFIYDNNGLIKRAIFKKVLVK